VGVTIGDAAGVGPELILRHWADARRLTPLIVYGSIEVLRAAAASLAFDTPGAQITLVRVDDPSAAGSLGPSDVPVVNVASQAVARSLNAALEDAARYPWGQPVAAFGALQMAALEGAVADAMAGEIDALVTTPWHKRRLRDANLVPTGHTEVLERLTGAERATMMLAGDVLRVALVTAHIPLCDVPRAVTAEAIVGAGLTMHRGLRDLYAIKAPRIAVCGLNPHAGEEGVLGSEDLEVIRPAIDTLIDHGVDATGPHPADTLFPAVVHGRVRADGVLAMYHDQGLIPLKTWHFGQSSNITLGLPIVRTSVDHGTAYDIAGRGVVDPGSFLYSIQLAARFVAGAST